MPDISPTSPSRDRQDDCSYDPPPDLARNNAIARINGPTIPGLPAPIASRGDSPPPTLPETPASKLDKRAFSSPALTSGTTTKPVKTESPDVTAAKMCALASTMYGPPKGYTLSSLGTCNASNDPCLSPAQANLVIDTCATNPMASMPSVGPETGTGETLAAAEAAQRTAMTQQLQMQQSVRSNPLAAVVVPMAIAAGASRQEIANSTQGADVVWGVATSFGTSPQAGAVTNMPPVPTRR